MPQHTGSCLCGGVTYVVQGDLPLIQVCHCKQCRKANGSAFACAIPIDSANFTLQSGGDLLKSYESTPGKLRKFCGRCGSPIYSQRTAMPDKLRLRAGVLDGDIQTRPGFHFYVDSKADWDTINDELPQYPEQAP